MRTSHLAPLLLASLLLNLWQWQADHTAAQPESDAAGTARATQCDASASQSSSQNPGQSLLAKLPGKGPQSEPAPAQEALPPIPSWKPPSASGASRAKGPC